jgi:hypothetical protein
MLDLNIFYVDSTVEAQSIFLEELAETTILHQNSNMLEQFATVIKKYVLKKFNQEIYCYDY